MRLHMLWGTVGVVDTCAIYSWHMAGVWLIYVVNAQRAGH